MTLEQLAESSGFAVSTINNFENGRTDVSERFLDRMAQILKVRKWQLTLEHEPAPPEQPLQEPKVSVIELVAELGQSLREARQALSKSEDVYRKIDRALRGPGQHEPAKSSSGGFSFGRESAAAVEQVLDDLPQGSPRLPRAASPSGSTPERPPYASQGTKVQQSPPKPVREKHES